MPNLTGTLSNSSSLDKSYTSARQRSGRCYHRVISGMRRRGQLRLLTLTTAREIDNESFQKHFRVLYMRLKRRGLILDYIRCPEYTERGLRHEHILFRGSYIQQAVISKMWAAIHGAPVVDIRAVYNTRRMAGYMASYMSKSPAGRYSYSFEWVWRGFCQSWTWLKRECSDRRLLIPLPMSKIIVIWNHCLDFRIKPDVLLSQLMEGGA